MLKLQYFGHLMHKADSLEKTLMLEKTKGRRREQQDEMVRWHNQLKGHESEKTLRDSEGQGSLAYYNPWGHKEQDTTEWLNNKRGHDPQFKKHYSRVPWLLSQPSCSSNNWVLAILQALETQPQTLLYRRQVFHKESHKHMKYYKLRQI